MALELVQVLDHEAAWVIDDMELGFDYGGYNKFTFEASGIPGSRHLIGPTLVQTAHAKGLTAMRTIIWQDTDPFLDKYKVEFYFLQSSPVHLVLLLIFIAASITALMVIGLTIHSQNVSEVKISENKLEETKIWNKMIDSVPEEEKAKILLELAKNANLSPEEEEDFFKKLQKTLGTAGLVAVVVFGGLVAYNLTKGR